jgi:hypothetical protein
MKPHTLTGFEHRTFGGIVWVCSCDAQGATVWTTEINAQRDHKLHVTAERNRDARNN